MPADAPVLPMMCSEAYKRAVAALNLVLSTKEVSARALCATLAVIRENPAHYTAYIERRRIMRELLRAGQLQPADVAAELSLSAELIAETPKNFQVWHHRSALWLEMLAPEQRRVLCAKEVAFLDSVLDVDAKNYHLWDYRLALVLSLDDERCAGSFSELDACRDELARSAAMLHEDLRNNSVWSYRHQLLRRLLSRPVLQSDADGPPLGRGLLRSEIDLVRSAVAKSPLNESSWAYLGGLLLLLNGWPGAQSDSICAPGARGAADAEAEGLRREMYDIVRGFSGLNPDRPASPHAISLAVDFVPYYPEDLPLLRTMLSEAAAYDAFRASYWRFLLSTLPGADADAGAGAPSP